MMNWISSMIQSSRLEVFSTMTPICSVDIKKCIGKKYIWDSPISTTLFGIELFIIIMHLIRILKNRDISISTN